MPKRKLPEWLLCKEYFNKAPQNLYSLCFIKCWELRVFEHWSWWDRRICLPKIDLEATCFEWCWKPICEQQFEPHSHIIDSHEWMLFTSFSHNFIDVLSLPDYINSNIFEVNVRKEPSCKRRLFE